MATVAVARPAQALRTRRDAPRSSIAKRTSGMAGNSAVNGQAALKKRKMEEPYVRTSQYILKKHRGKPVSFSIHLHQAYWRFEDQEGSFAYDSPMKFVLQHLRRETVPHDMMEEFHLRQVPFYDGCLIVEVHNHRSVSGKDKASQDQAAGGDDARFSMHNYHNYITPSPNVPYPKKAKTDEPTKDESAADEAMPNQAGKDKPTEGPTITTLVLHPTPLSQHIEMLILANTPVSEMRSKKRNIDGQTPSSAQPTTPQLSVPQTPLASGSRVSASGQKMCLEEQDFYQFQADMLVATEPPLYLEPVDDLISAQKVLDLLAHPLHSDPPPSPKTRKRTHAEVAAEDAQNAENERRMLIMDERIKPSLRAGSGANSGDNQGTAASLGFSRFKTIQMVKEKVEEQERLKKEEEAQAAIVRRQQEEANAAQAAAQAREKTMQEQQLQQQRLMAERQRRAALARQQHMANVQAQMAAQNSAQSQHNNMMPNQQANFQHPASMAQASPVVRQQTPMVNSSPMLGQNGFGMATTSSQGAGSPPRPTSAAVPNHNMAMARQASQQHASGSNTPHMPQGTPHMPGQAVPNRQMSQTPRMAHGSPAPGTPGAVNMNHMPMHTPQHNNMTPAQMAMLQARSGMPAGSPGQQNHGPTNMTPDQISSIGNQQEQQRRQLLLRQQMAAGQLGAGQLGAGQISAGQNSQVAALMQQRQVMMARQQQQQMQQRMNGGQANGSHPGMQGTPQMGHAHPNQQAGMDMNGVQQLTPQQQQQQQQMRNAQQGQMVVQLRQLVAQYGGNILNVPQHAVQQLSPPARGLLLQQMQRQNALRAAHQMASTARQAQDAGQAVAGNSGGNPAYMQTLRQQQQALLAQQQAQNQMSGGGGGGGGGLNMAGNGLQQFGNQDQQSNILHQRFTEMQNALGPNNQHGMQ